MITATFVGYLLNGFIGGLAATAGIFAAPVLITVVAAPLLLRCYKHPRVAGFVRGVGVTVVGILVGATWLVAQQAIGDWPTAAILAGTLLTITFAPKVPDPIVIFVSGVLGLFAYSALHPQWLLR